MSEFSDLIKTLAGSKSVPIMICEVKSIYNQELTVVPFDGSAEFDVLLDNLSNSLEIMPKIGSKVVVGFAGMQPFVIKFGEIDTVKFKINGLYQIENQAENLGTILHDLADTLSKLLTVLPGATSPLPPTEIVKFEALKLRIKALLQ